MSLVVQFSAIGFRPYREVGEFVNVGIVCVEARSRFIGFRLTSAQKTKRISACFPELDLAIYKDGIRRLEVELSSLAIETNLWSDDSHRAGKNHPSQEDLFAGKFGSDGADLFRTLTAPRASPFFFGTPGTRLTADIDDCLDELYGRYVEHWNLAPTDYEEKKMIRRVKTLLRQHRLGRLYKDAPRVGTDAYHVGIPLAFTPSHRDTPEKAIKPLNLDQPTPTRVFTKGDEWIAKVRRLEHINYRPDRFLFVVKKPNDPETRAAADEICEGLLQQGAEIADLADDKAILDFARIDEQPELRLTN